MVIKLFTYKVQNLHFTIITVPSDKSDNFEDKKKIILKQFFYFYF